MTAPLYRPFAAAILVGFAAPGLTPVGAAVWNAILHATHVDQFFHHAPIRVFPTAGGAGTTGWLAGLLVDIYLY